MATSTSKIGFHDLDNEVNEKIGSIATLESRPVNNNLLINSNFANPVNQRGVTAESWTANCGYGIDRWKFSTGDGAINVIEMSNRGITFKGTNLVSNDLYQDIEIANVPLDGAYTFSMCIDGKIISGGANTQYQEDNIYTVYNDGEIMVMIADWYSSKKVIRFNIRFTDNDEHTIEWAKLELGYCATPYVPRLYAEEFKLCQRYYQYLDPNDCIVRGLDSNVIYFVKQLPEAMRCTPTADLSNIKVLSNLSNESGYSFSYAGDNDIIFITATKTSHGKSFTNILTLGGTFTLDAEL